MMKIIALTASTLLLLSLSGCYVAQPAYAPPPVAYAPPPPPGYYAPAPPAYYAPGYYAAPAPAYYGTPFSVGIGFGGRGGWRH